MQGHQFLKSYSIKYWKEALESFSQFIALRCLDYRG